MFSFIPYRAKEKKQQIKEENERKKQAKRIIANDPLAKLEQVRKTYILRGKYCFNVITLTSNLNVSCICSNSRVSFV
jgi:hypothetical protein